jgi:ribosomal protein S18 acetylase RimI-like enzyme
VRQDSGWIIRTMTLDDYDAVYRLWCNTPGMGLNTTDDSREGISAYLKRNPNTCFVAEEGDRVVGVILSGHDGRRGFIHHTAVSGERQKNGIGSALVERAMVALEREGIHKVALVVFSRNETGNSFWEKRGFTRRDDLVYRNRSITEQTRIDT